MTPSPFCPSVRPKILKPQKLTVYLAGVAGTAALLSAPQAEAAVTAITFGFGPVLDQSDGQNYFSVGSFGVLSAFMSTNSLSLGTSLNYGSGSVYNNRSFNSNPPMGLPLFFANGAVIGGGAYASGISGHTYFQSQVPALNLTSDQLNKNIGFETSTGNWGWANVSWDNTAKALTVNSAYVESTAGVPITITAAPEPSRALLALAGLGGVALRRRRKQVV